MPAQTKLSSFPIILGFAGMSFLLSIVFFKEYVFELIAPPAVEISETKQASKEVAEILLKLDKINLDTSILTTGYLQNVTILPSYPLDTQTLSNFGKTNPFVGTFVAVTAPSTSQGTSTVGGVIYSQQRSVNEGRAIVPVRGGRGQAPQGRR